MPFASKILRFFGKADTIFYSLPWLMFLLIMGTVTQKDLGLYEATEKYFNSIVLWLGPIPTPGGITTMGFIFISLCVKFIFYSAWSKKRVGIILTHLGILLLLLGGIITAIVSKEGFMIIPEGRNINSISDYHERVLKIKNGQGIIELINFDELQKGQLIKISNLEIKILYKCDNCGVRAPTELYEDLKGLAKNMELYAIALEKKKETNFSGLMLNIQHSENPRKSGTYIVMEDIQKNPIFEGQQEKIEIALTRKSQMLPFSITLKDFRKIDYPGTDKARQFESDIIIHDGDVFWPAKISMNKPLRYKGYTLYQSSFKKSTNTEVTVLNVVQNAGRVFPYVSTLVIFLGLLLHLIIHGQRQREKEAVTHA